MDLTTAEEFKGHGHSASSGRVLHAGGALLLHVRPSGLQLIGKDPGKGGKVPCQARNLASASGFQAGFGLQGGFAISLLAAVPYDKAIKTYLPRLSLMF